MKRVEIADQIVASLEKSKEDLKKQFAITGRVRSCFLDDLLDPALARTIFEAYPRKEELVLQSSLRERKHIGVQMDSYNPLLEEALCAFHDQRIVRLVGEITGLNGLMPDATFTRGGISLMAPGDFLNPHLDNSHDRERKNYRALNLLYYISPEWKIENGGNLELWDNGPGKPQRTIHCKFNRLVIMLTDRRSWHSVSQVVADTPRCCVSNYYYTKTPVDGAVKDYYHVTTFRGRPEQRLRDWILRGDGVLRNAVRMIFKGGLARPHTYKRDGK
jgi:Rps23 Pro-64 3,4-dihydroxylase Tpa1-like proline 4-hydroxylase